jgi:hypothetical protein
MARQTAPWKRANPKKKAAREHLSPTQKAAAKRRASEAGRPYPNLVDNMAVSSRGTSRAKKK